MLPYGPSSVTNAKYVWRNLQYDVLHFISSKCCKHIILYLHDQRNELEFNLQKSGVCLIGFFPSAYFIW